MRTYQERIDRLAQKIRDFRIAVSGGGGLEGGFGKLPDQGVTLAHIEKSFEKFLLTGQNGIQAWGSLKKGYVLFGAPVETGSTGFPAPITPPSTPGCNVDITITASGSNPSCHITLDGTVTKSFFIPQSAIDTGVWFVESDNAATAFLTCDAGTPSGYINAALSGVGTNIEIDVGTGISCTCGEDTPSEGFNVGGDPFNPAGTYSHTFLSDDGLLTIDVSCTVTC